MAITQKTIKLLWGSAAGRCSFPGCGKRLCLPESEESAPYTIGEMAHIRGEKPDALRHDASQTDAERNGYANLILLCPTDHTTIDKHENLKTYSVNALLNMKAQHEREVADRFKSDVCTTKEQVARLIHPLLVQNHTVFENYGPHSEVARKNPESQAHAVWLSERLATILPNNRRMAELTAAHAGLFTPDEQKVLAAFEVHARGYERWVEDELAYEAVVRFPKEFDALISELARA